MLNLFLLGYPKILINEEPVSNFVTNKAEALFYYLAVTKRTHGRSHLANLFWPDVSEQTARKNLRDVLSNLRQLLGQHLIILREEVTFNSAEPYWLDVDAYRSLIKAPTAGRSSALQQALTLYQNEFLTGFHVRNAIPFEEWQLFQREELAMVAGQGMHRLIDLYIQEEAYEAGLALTYRLLEAEPWDEKAYRKQMLLFMLNGQRGAALRQYEVCHRILARELGVPPLPETVDLYQQIRTGNISKAIEIQHIGKYHTQERFQAN